MNWLFKTLAGAFVAGVGLKLGSEVYDTVKKQLQRHTSGLDSTNPSEDQAKEETPDIIDLSEEDGPKEAGW